MVNSIFTLLLLPALALCVPHGHRHAHSIKRDDSAVSVLATSGQVVLKNNCDYDVSVEPYPGPGCEAGSGGSVSAGSSWNDTLKSCSGGNTSLKVYKSGGASPMQFEYGLDGSNIWYDMSFIDCLSSGYDFSQCAGSPWYMGGNQNCHSYACSGGQACCSQGYCDSTATGVDPAPNTACGADQGYTESSALSVTIELCTSS